MSLDAILEEVVQLQNVSTRLEELAEFHPLMSEALLQIAGTLRRTVSLLAVVVATKQAGLIETPSLTWRNQRKNQS
jgi:hypothetical protein